MDSLRTGANQLRSSKYGGVALGIIAVLSALKVSFSIKSYIQRKRVNKAASEFCKENDIKVCVIGAGISGICAAIKLKQKNINFAVFEMSSNIGGTWLDNNYPAAGCDVQAYIYNYSFYLDFPWSAAFVRRDEILKYLHAVMDRFKIRQNIHFSHRILSCEFDESLKTWQVTYERLPNSPTKLEMDKLSKSSGEIVTKSYNFLISATGQLNQPKIPNIEGLESFKGVQFHTSRWNQNIPLEGKNVLAIGSGPSAIQAFPEVYKSCKNFYLLSRSGTYFLTRAWLEAKYSSLSLAVFKIVPFLLKLRYAFGIYLADLNFHVLFTRKENEETMTRTQSLVRDRALYAMQSALKPSYETYVKVTGEESKEKYEEYMEQRADKLIEQLTPHILPGCKRLAFSSKWFQMFTSPNVTLLKKNLKRISSSTVYLAPLKTDESDVKEGKGKEEEEDKIENIDIIIWATGFHATQMAEHIPFKVKKSSGEVITLNEKWRVTPKAFKGCCVDGFPNFFIIYGPNTNLGHNSITYMVECSVSYVTNLIHKVMSLKKKTVEVKKTVFDEYNEKIQKELLKTVFTANCNNWYKDKDGNSPTNWPKSVHAFNKMTQLIDLENFILQ